MSILLKTHGLYAALLLMAWNVIAPAIHAEIVYDNVRDYRQSFYPPSQGSAEYGDQVQLAGKARTITEFRFEYFGEFQATGTEMVRVRFYANDGPGLPGLANTEQPGTLLFESALEPVVPGFNTVTLRGLSVPVTNTFTWTVQFEGLSGRYQQRAGLVFYNAPSVGSSYDDFWQRTGTNWSIWNFRPGYFANFAARVAAVPDPPLAIVSNSPLTNGVRELRIDGPTYQAAVLEVSPNGTNWSVLSRFVLSGHPITILDEGAAAGSTNYYQVHPVTAPFLELSQGKRLTNGVFSLLLTGSPGRTFFLESSVDLNGWLPFYSNVLVSSTMDATDSFATNWSKRFYRAEYVTDIPLVMGTLSKTNAGFSLLLAGGPPGRDCLVQTSSNLLDWAVLSTNTFSFTDGTFMYIDRQPTNTSQRWYRTTLLPLP